MASAESMPPLLSANSPSEILMFLRSTVCDKVSLPIPSFTKAEALSPRLICPSYIEFPACFKWNVVPASISTKPFEEPENPAAPAFNSRSRLVPEEVTLTVPLTTNRPLLTN